MKTKITEILGIKYPILLSGMSWISVPKMVAAVSNAGGLGILATGPFNAEQTRAAVKEIRSLTDKPFGANATLLFPGAAENAKVLLEEKVPVINFSLGKGDWIVKESHGYGGKVIATVVNARHAQRAEDYGCDAVISTGHEAAAHGEHVTSLVLVPSLVDAVKIPVIATGGFGDGRGLAAALALGAAGIQMGTRFICTAECIAHVNYKQMIVQANERATLVTGVSLGHPVRCIRNPMVREFERLEKSGATEEEIVAFGGGKLRAAALDGDVQNGSVMAGQVSGLIHDVLPVAELIRRTVAEAEAHIARLSGLIQPVHSEERT